MKKNEIRIGVCRHTDRKVLQIKDACSDDAVDEIGWLCLHDETVEEEVVEMLKFKYEFPFEINLN